MSIELLIANSDEDIAQCFAVFKELRPHLVESEFLPQIRRQQAQSYRILALKQDGRIKSVAGFRFAEFLAWGRVLYIDDLSTLQEARSQGFAELLLNWLIAYAKEDKCQGVHLDSGYARQAAHRLYLRKGFVLDAHHLSLTF